MSPDALYLLCPSCAHREPVGDGADEPAAAPGRGDADGDGAADAAADGPADDTGAEAVTCPACGSTRAHRTPDPALPDAGSEASVKLDADAVEDG